VVKVTAALDAFFRSPLLSSVVERRYFGDIQRTWYVIVICGVLLAVLVAFLWLLIMKYFTMLMVARIPYRLEFVCS
jgi:hypothetical protein